MGKQQEWVSAREATKILTANTDHEVHPDYLRVLARSHKITYRATHGRGNEYLKSDVEAYRVKPHGTPRIRPISTRKSQQKPEPGEGDLRAKLAEMEKRLEALEHIDMAIQTSNETLV